MVADNGHVAFMKTLADGRTAVVTVKAIDYLHSASSTLTIDGEVITEHLGPYHAVSRLVAKERPDLTAMLGPLGLNAEEAAQIKGIWQEVADTAVDSAEQETGLGAAERFDQDHPDPWNGTEARQEKRALADAIEALAAFDREHPEVAARAAAERDRIVQRALEGRD